MSRQKSLGGKVILCFLILALSCLFLVISPQMSGSVLSSSKVTWQEPVRLNSASDKSFYPNIACTGSALHAVWSDDWYENVNPEIWYSRSTDEGKTWSEKKQLTSHTKGGAFNPCLAASGSNLYLVWTDSMNSPSGEIFFAKSSDEGVTWSKPVSLTDRTLRVDCPVVAASGQTAYASWLTFVEKPLSAVYSKFSTDGGNTWQIAPSSTNCLAFVGGLKVAAYANKACIVWTEFEAKGSSYNGEKAHYHYIIYNGSSWSKEYANEATVAFHTSVALDNEFVYIAYESKEDEINVDFFPIESPDQIQSISITAGECPVIRTNGSEVLLAYNYNQSKLKSLLTTAEELRASKSDPTKLLSQIVDIGTDKPSDKYNPSIIDACLSPDAGLIAWENQGGIFFSKGAYAPQASPTPTSSQTPTPTLTLTDVPSDYWASAAILDLVQAGIIKGYPDGTFKPENPVTRAEFAKMALLSLGLKEENPENPTFPDVSKDHWAYGYIEGAVKAGLIKGYPDGSFQPEGQVTKAEEMAVIVRAKGWTNENPSVLHFADCLEGDWFTVYVESAFTQEIVKIPDPYIVSQEDSALKFDPNSPATRAQTAVFLWRMRGK